MTMYGNLKIQHYKAILRRIRDNHESTEWVTHKKIRIYLECMSDLWSQLSIPDNAEFYLAEIEFLFRAMNCRISHEKRAFLAEQLLKRLEPLESMAAQQEKQSEYDPSNF